MTPKPRTYSSREVVAALVRAGFVEARQIGSSHRVYKHPDPLPDGTHRRTTIVMGKKEIPRGTLNAILREARLTWEELDALVR